jgi:hypothetical protein
MLPCKPSNGLVYLNRDQFCLHRPLIHARGVDSQKIAWHLRKPAMQLHKRPPQCGIHYESLDNNLSRTAHVAHLRV